jgi:A/G-specific adenine glycosylase
MLQQTRAQAVIPYYERFLARFPTAAALAAAREQEVLALWSGLGYYSRARNLHRAAARIAAIGFPRDYASLRGLPGIGDYTAAAVASIAFGEPRAVVDGNVLRVVARVTGDAADIAAQRTRERFRKVAQDWMQEPMARLDPAMFNQALMELGATVCLPRHPRCAECPLAACCRGLAAGTAQQLPVKLGGAQPVYLEGMLLVARSRGRVLLRQREAGGPRMPGFWDLPSPADLPAGRPGAVLGSFRHTITHHRYTFTVRAADAVTGRAPAGFRWFAPRQFAEIPLSTTARKGLGVAGIL